MSIRHDCRLSPRPPSLIPSQPSRTSRQNDALCIRYVNSSGHVSTQQSHRRACLDCLTHYLGAWSQLQLLTMSSNLGAIVAENAI